MNPSAPPPPILVRDPDALTRMAATVAQAPRVALDTESNSLHAYRERVCLIQFSLPGRDYLLDTLAVSSLDALKPILLDSKIEKIFHAAEYDLICLRRDFGMEVRKLFDTMVAARTLGWRKVGLASILEERFGVKMNKRLQRADWGRRPLTEEQLAYARLDTHYLIRLRDELETELQRAGRWEEAREEFERISLAPSPGGTGEGWRSQGGGHGGGPGSSGSSTAGRTEGFWRIAGSRELKPQQQAVLKELHHYRDTMARRLNRPPFKVLGDSVLVALAEHMPANPERLSEQPGMTPGQLRRHQRGLLEAIRRGKAAPPPRLPRNDRVPDEVIARYEALHTWRKKLAAKRGVESDVIVPREVLWELARRAPRTPEELHAVPGLMPWRRETYGPEILQVLNS